MKTPDHSFLFRASPYPYLVMACDLTIIDVNDTYLRGVGRNREDVVGRYLFDAFPVNPEDPDSTNLKEVKSSLETAIATGRPHTVAFLRYSVPKASSNGRTFEERYWSTVHTPVLDEDGKVAYVFQNPIDVTELYRFDRDAKSASLDLKSSAIRDTEHVNRAQMHEALSRILNDERGHLRNLFNQAPGFVALLTGPTHVFEMANDAFYQLVGHRDILGKPVWKALPEVGGQGYEALLDSVYASGESWVGRARPVAVQRQANGPVEQRYIDLSYQPYRAEDGIILGVFAQGHDVTEAVEAQAAQRESESKLLESQERYLALFNAIDHGFCTIQMAFDANDKAVDYQFLETSPSFTRQTGIQNGAGRWMREVAPDHDEFWFETYGRVAVTGESMRFDNYSTPLKRWWSVYAFRIHDPSLRQIAVLFHDITEQKSAEEALRVSEERLRTLFNSMNEAFVINEAMIDESGRVTDYRFIESNPAFNRYTGLATSNGRTLRELMPDAAPRWIEHFEHVQRTGEPVQFEARIDPVDRWLIVSVTPLGESAGNRLAVVFADITERKHAEKGLRDANRRKDEFLAMLAHELRNPLAPISAAAELMQLTQLNETHLRKTSEVIQRQVRHMTELVDDLLDVSRVTRGLVAVKKTPQDLKNIVADAIEQVRPLMEAQRHQFVIDLSPEPAHVSGDHKRLVQILTNLLNNAAKYTPPGGSIQLQLKVKDDRVLLSVRDNGIGIAPGLQEHVFELFAQAERTADRAQGGLGLGLALVKSMVELHDGQVSCHSEGPGKGSCFTVSLPRLAEQQRVPEHSEGDGTLPGESRKLRVLVVDDNADAANMLAMLLKALGHEVLIEHSPQQALARALLETPDACVLDIGLPGLDGNELARRLRAQPEMASALLIAVTGYGREHDRESTFAAGFDHHFVKPVDTAKLVAVFNRMGNLKR